MTADSPRVEQPEKSSLLKHIFLVSRVVIVAIIGMLIASILVILAGFGQLIRIFSFVAGSGFLNPEAGKFLSVAVTEMIDLYLIGLVLIIFALGLYQLFINPDISIPEWMNTSSFESLKARLLIVIAVVLPVMFLGFVAMATEGTLIAGLGIGISLVMIAIGYLLSVATRGQIGRKRPEMQETGRDE